MALQLCPVVTRRPGPSLRTSSRASLPRVQVRPAASGLVTRVLATTSRWSTTVSNTVICNLSARSVNRRAPIKFCVKKLTGYF